MNIYQMTGNPGDPGKLETESTFERDKEYAREMWKWRAAQAAVVIPIALLVLLVLAAFIAAIGWGVLLILAMVGMMFGVIWGSAYLDYHHKPERGKYED